MDTNQMREKAGEWKQGAEEVGRTAQEQAGELAGKAQEWTEKAKGTARDAGAAADLYVHEYAWTSLVAVALFAGALGYLLGSRRR